MAPGGLRDGFKWPSRELRGAMGDPGMVLGRAKDAMSDFSLRFPMFLDHRTLWAYVFQSLWALGRSRLTPVQPNRPRPSKGWPPPDGILGGFGPWVGNLKGGVQVPLLLIQYTCYLILDIRHLILDTCTWVLKYLYTYTCTWNEPLQPCDPQGVLSPWLSACDWWSVTAGWWLCALAGGCSRLLVGLWRAVQWVVVSRCVIRIDLDKIWIGMDRYI